MAISIEKLAVVLRRQAEEVLAAHPGLQHEWVDQGAIVTLKFSPVDRTGFEVAVQAGAGYLHVLMGRNHDSFDVGECGADEAVSCALALVRDLLSPDMRLREIRSSGAPYKWFVEARASEGWRCESETGLLFFNYFGRRSEHIFQNRQLPGRLAG